jgi:hypothetical protein
VVIAGLKHVLALHPSKGWLNWVSWHVLRSKSVVSLQRQVTAEFKMIGPPRKIRTHIAGVKFLIPGARVLAGRFRDGMENSADDGWRLSVCDPCVIGSGRSKVR